MRVLKTSVSDFSPVSSFSMYHSQFRLDSMHFPCVTTSLGSFFVHFSCVLGFDVRCHHYLLIALSSMVLRREPAASRAQKKCPIEASQLEARRKMRFDNALFSTMEEYQQYKHHYAKKQIVPGININFP